MNKENANLILSRLRTGSAPNVVILFFGSFVLVIGLGYLALQLRPDARRHSVDQVVRVYCASGVAKPVEQIIGDYNNRYGTAVEILRTGGSGELAGQIKTEFETGVTNGADLYITADDRLLTQARTEGLVAECFPLAEQRPVIAVAASSALQCGSLAQMLAIDGIKFGIASEQAAVGKLVRQIAKSQGVLDRLETEKTTDSENVMTLAQALATGSLDAAIIWDTTVSQLNQANAEPVLKIAGFADPANQVKGNIAAGVVSTSARPTAALKFARFLTAPETGKPVFDEYGFTFVTGDTWEEVPEIHLYCGSMFTPVLEETVREFAAREGVNFYPRWEGCGKLVASMKSIEDPGLFPDGYLACDVSFLEEVKDHFRAPTTISTNQIVMAVRSTVSPDVDSPRKLLDRGLRIGICDPEQSALGRLTKELLSESSQPSDEDLYQRIRKQAAVTVDVGPTLISQLAAGGLDVAFVYRSNIMADPAGLNSVRLVGLATADGKGVATQPWVISRTTVNPELMQRFFDRITRPEIQERFKQYGFQ